MASQVIKIVCLKWGTKYGPEYVNNLFAAVSRNITLPFEFWCFTDNAAGIDPAVKRHRLPHARELDTWWNKLWLFSSEMPFKINDVILYIDLDTLIVDNIDDFVKIPQCGDIVMLEDFYHGIAKTAGQAASGLMSWTHGTRFDIWKNFIANPQHVVKMCHPHGDQRWIQICTNQPGQRRYWQKILPNRVISYKVHCQRGLPKQAAVVCYHGKPSIPDSATKNYQDSKRVIPAQSWVLDYWHDQKEKSLTPCKIRYVELPAKYIFGMVGRCGGGYNTIWEDWSTSGRIARQRIMQDFESGMNEICGHYDKLEVSMLNEGVRNPIVVTGGFPRKRQMKYVPPDMHEQNPAELFFLEGTTGGSRLHIAQKHNMTIPCILNDWHNRFPNAPEIGTANDALPYYKDRPKRIFVDPKQGFVEAFDTGKIGHHLGEDFSEEKVVPLRAPLWVSIMNKYGYRVDRLPEFVEQILSDAGINQRTL